jgi:hypothetical protein
MVSCRYTPAKNGISINKKSIHDFFNYIGICPITCFDYKYEIEKYNASAPVYGSIEERRKIWKKSRETKRLKREELGIPKGIPGFLSANEEKINILRNWLLSLSEGCEEVTTETAKSLSYGRRTSLIRGVKRLIDRENLENISIKGNSITVQ